MAPFELSSTIGWHLYLSERLFLAVDVPKPCCDTFSVLKSSCSSRDFQNVDFRKDGDHVIACGGDLRELSGYSP